MPDEPRVPPSYIGDGVYASFDGYQIWLRTERANGVHAIALEYGVLKNLMAYANRVWKPVAKGGG